MLPLSRRSIIGRLLASVPAVAVAAGSAPALSQFAPNDPVFAFAERAIQLHREHEAACDALAPCDEAMIDWRKENPKPVRVNPYRVNRNEIMDPHTGKLSATEVTIYEPGADMRKAFEEHKRVVRNWKRRELAAERRTGYRAADAAQDRASEASSAAIEALALTRPCTLAGLAAKARAALIINSDNYFDWQLAQDIDALANAA